MSHIVDTDKVTVVFDRREAMALVGDYTPGGAKKRRRSLITAVYWRARARILAALYDEYKDPPRGVPVEGEQYPVRIET